MDSASESASAEAAPECSLHFVELPRSAGADAAFLQAEIIDPSGEPSTQRMWRVTYVDSNQSRVLVDCPGTVTGMKATLGDLSRKGAGAALLRSGAQIQLSDALLMRMLDCENAARVSVEQLCSGRGASCSQAQPGQGWARCDRQRAPVRGA